LSLDVERVRCPDCKSEHFVIRHIPSAGTFYFICVACQMNNNHPSNKFITTELIEVQTKSLSKDESGDGSGGGEEEADEDCPSGRPLGISPKIQSLMRTEEEQKALVLRLRTRNKDGRWRKKRSDVGKPRKRLNINGGKVEGLDPELRDILKHTNLIPCVQCRTEMDWVDGSHEFGELRLECPECHWTTCITDPKLMALYKHRRRIT